MDMFSEQTDANIEFLPSRMILAIGQSFSGAMLAPIAFFDLHFLGNAKYDLNGTGCYVNELVPELNPALLDFTGKL